MMEKPTIFPLADNALTIELGCEIKPELNEKALFIADSMANSPFPGFIEAVPAYASATLFYDPIVVREEFPDFETAFDAVKNLAEELIGAKNGKRKRHETRTVEIPFRITDEYSPDLNHVAEKSGLPPSDVVEIFIGATYRVYMLGFMPGFSYMGEVDERIAVPRKQTPRLKVAAGSVGIAGRQTGVYSLDSPGGWQIIGRTSMKMFTPEGEMPCPLKPGDLVCFGVE